MAMTDTLKAAWQRYQRLRGSVPSGARDAFLAGWQAAEDARRDAVLRTWVHRPRMHGGAGPTTAADSGRTGPGAGLASHEVLPDGIKAAAGQATEACPHSATHMR